MKTEDLKIGGLYVYYSGVEEPTKWFCINKFIEIPFRAPLMYLGEEKRHDMTSSFYIFLWENYKLPCIVYDIRHIFEYGSI